MTEMILPPMRLTEAQEILEGIAVMMDNMQKTKDLLDEGIEKGLLDDQEWLKRYVDHQTFVGMVTGDMIHDLPEEVKEYGRDTLGL